MHSINIASISPQRYSLAESPIWNPHFGCLHFVDIEQSQLYCYYPTNNRLQVTDTPSKPSTVVLCSNRQLLVGTAEGLFFYNIALNKWSYFLGSELVPDNFRFNDGKCSPDGKLWIGTMHKQPYNHSGSLYAIDKSGNTKVMLEKLTISNGLDWHQRQQMFYHIDSANKKVQQYKYDAHSDKLLNSRTFTSFDFERSEPDGMSIDSEGMIWIAHFGAGCITRHHHDTGACLFRIDFNARQITSCAFGGASLQDLYVTSASNGLDEKELAHKQDGNIFRIKGLGVKGRLPFEFTV